MVECLGWLLLASHMRVAAGVLQRCVSLWDVASSVPLLRRESWAPFLGAD